MMIFQEPRSQINLTLDIYSHVMHRFSLIASGAKNRALEAESIRR